MAAGVSINTKFLLQVILFSALLVVSLSFQDVPYTVDSMDGDVEMSDLYSVHRAKRQVATVNSTTTMPMSTASTVATTTTLLPTAPPTTAPKTTTKASTAAVTTTPTAPTTTGPFSNATIINDSHRYYESRTVVEPREAMNYWMDLDTAGFFAMTHKTLSDSHRTAATVKLKFEFPFYGHMIKQITIATGGFIYVSEFLHRWLTATQYIAPLMANFDTTIGDSKSNIKYAHDDNKVIVQWENVYLQDQKNYGGYTFQCIIHKSGKIVFVYKQIPKAVSYISTSQHPVKIGLSDAYYYDRMQGKLRRRTIVEYHKVSLDRSSVESNTAIILLPIKTCISITDCNACATANISFKCAWCGKLKKCSDGMDRHRQLWQKVGCTTSRSDPCPAKAADTQVALIIVIVVIILVAISAVLSFIVYAYKNPNSSAGIWLIEHRPSKIASSIASKVRFWRGDSSNSGDKYQVSATPGQHGNESAA